MKRLIAMLLATAMLGAPADLLGKTTNGNEKKSAKTTEITFVDSKILDAGIEKLLKKQNVDSSQVSVALEFTATGETYYYNADQWMYTASLCKLPVAMTFEKMLKNGEIEADKMSFSDSWVIDRVIAYSNYSWYSKIANRIYGEVESPEQRKQDFEYSGINEDKLPKNFYTSQKYSARFFLGIIEELYYNSDDYPQVIESMKSASPYKYLRDKLGKKYDIAQKYGSTDDVVHAAGIIYTECPILVVIMTDKKSDMVGNRIIGNISEYLAEQATEWNGEYLNVHQKE